MRTDAVWNLGGYWEAPRFSQERSSVKFEITKCHIIVNVFGYYDLFQGTTKIKRINLKEFMLYKKYVKEVIHEEDII